MAKYPHLSGCLDEDLAAKSLLEALRQDAPVGQTSYLNIDDNRVTRNTRDTTMIVVLILCAEIR